MKSMTYGKVPSQSEFQEAFRNECGIGGHFPIRSGALRNIPMDGDWKEDELWEKINQVCRSFHNGDTSIDDEELSICGDVLQILGFEWI